MTLTRRTTAAFGALFFLLFACGDFARAQMTVIRKPTLVGDQIKIDSGMIVALPPDSSGIRAFKGIPYAAPPIGDLRWRAPLRPQPWADVRSATEFSANCIQSIQAGDPSPSEDCLYLNIWTGARTIAERRPVLMWIHGGGFSSGSGRDPRTGGENLAERGIVVVTINYRLGALGFLAHPELSKESIHRSSGNYGLLDQLAALQWIQRNIMAFGGDPQNVTLAGHSAGALCVNLLVASPLAKNQFRRVLAHSGAVVSSFSGSYPESLATAEQGGLAFMKAVGAQSLKELRGKPAAELMKTRGGRLAIDGYVIPTDPYEIFATGKHNDVPILNGWNQEDIAAGGTTTGAEAFKQYVHQRYGVHADEILRAFPAATDEQAKRSAANLSRDVLFAWQGYTWVRLQERTGKAASYTYYFTRVPPDTPQQTARGAYHGAEIPYALDNLDKLKRPHTETDRKLSAAMSSYWINYLKSGNPNSEALPEWPRFSAKTDQVMEFGDMILARQTPFKEEMDALDQVFEKVRKAAR